MRNKSFSALLIAAAVLINLVWLVDNLTYNDYAERTERGHNLADAFECLPLYKCAPDFDGDGEPDELFSERLPGVSEDWLVARVQGGPALRLVYNRSGGKTRTRVAVMYYGGSDRVYVYDEASYAEPLRAVYAWNGSALAELPPSGYEGDLLDALAWRAGRHDLLESRTFRGFRVTLYFVTLSGLLGVALYLKLSARRRLP